MFRDRTNLYLSYRRTFPHSSSLSDRFDTLLEEEQGLINNDGYSDANDPFLDEHRIENGPEEIEMKTLPPAFLDMNGELDESLHFISKRIEELTVLYKKNILPGFNDRSMDEEEIEKLNYIITRKFQHCYGLVKKLDTIKKTNNETKLIKKKSELIMIENIKKNYALKIQKYSSSFRKLQNNYIKFLKQEDFDANLNSKSVATISSSNLATLETETKEVEEYSRQALKESSTVLQKHDSANLIRQREQEISKLAQGILEVSAIFKEMQNMVIDQGTILDRIDYNLENVKTEIHESNKQLNKASNFQKRTQKCKIILLLSLLVLGLLIVVITKPH
ncbi:t-SNARE syntaxin TLG2, partial [Ascoidea rubescens DSM 1968]